MNIAYLFVVGPYKPDFVFNIIKKLDNGCNCFFIHFKKGIKYTVPACMKNNNNIHIIDERYNAGWGGFKVILATLDLLKLAFNSGNKFDYFINMSGNCYPVKSNYYIDDFFQNNFGKSFIEGIMLPSPKIPGGGNYKYELPWFQDELQSVNPYIKKLIYLIIHLPYRILKIKRKIPHNYLPYYGSQWWALHSTAVKYLLDFTSNNNNFLMFFKRCWVADEQYIHTVLYNNKDEKKSIINTLFRYIEWIPKGPPKILTNDDYEKIIQSNYCFARKFDYDISKELIERIDKEYSG